MQEVKYNQNNNIILTGEISSLPNNVKGKKNCEYKIKSYRKSNPRNKNLMYDEIELTIDTQLNFPENVKVGERFCFEGELLSQNKYEKSNKNKVSEALQRAVNTYMRITGCLPVETLKTRKIEWKKLYEYSLISKIPEDSKYDQDNKKTEGLIVYRVNGDGIVTKYTEHVKYVVLVHHFEQLTIPLDEKKGDNNKVLIRGLINKEVKFYEGTPPSIKFLLSTDVKYFSKTYYANIHVFTRYQNTIQYIKDKNFKKDDFVEVVGRFQTRKITHKNVKRVKIPNGKIRSNKNYIDRLTGEISISKIKKISEGKK